MQKTDLAKEQKHYYRAKATPGLVTISAANYITVEGSGDPSAPPFNARIKALYAAAYNIKKICKLQEKDFKVPALEGLWWTLSGEPVADVPRGEWQWKLQIQLPAFVTHNDCKQAIALAGNKRLPYLGDLAFEHIPATLAVQVLHTGSYEDEPATIEKMYHYIRQHGLEVSGTHHELYITDPRKTPAERLKTVLRLDVKSK